MVHMVARHPNEVPTIIQELERQSKTARDFIAQGPALKATVTHEFPNGDPDGINLAVPVSGPDFPPTAYGLTRTAHQQLGERLAIPRPYYQRMLEAAPALLAENVNTWLGRDGDRRWMTRMLDGNVRALVSDRYRPLDSYALAFRSLRVSKAAGAVPHRVDLTDDRFEMRLIHRDWQDRMADEDGIAVARYGGNTAPIPGPVSDYHDEDGGGQFLPGAYLKNSETGRGGFGVGVYVIDAICNNGYIVEQGVAQIHLGERHALGELVTSETQRKKDDALWSEVEDVIRGVFDREKFTAIVKRFRASQEAILEKPIEAVEAVCADAGFDDQEKQDILNELMSPSWERPTAPNSVFALLSAVTAMAHKVDEDSEKVTDLQTVGARLLDPDHLVRIGVKVR